jgi:glycosyltransferase involved in cell wall biosynthesis
MSAGLPIVSCLQGMMADAIRDHGIGCLYETEDDAQLSRILCDLADDRSRLEAMAANSRRLFEERFVAERVFADFASHLEQIASEGKRADHTTAHRQR